MAHPTTNKPQYVAYYRVSTKQQAGTGLGVAAQRQIVNSFTECPECLVAEYTETESGKNDDRPELANAIAHAKRIGARLVIAKLDRLSRNAAFIFKLRDTGVDFVCADMPDANTLTIGIFASIAQHERELISQRTKDALAAKKAQGVKLGNPENLTAAARKKGSEAIARKARQSKAWRQAGALARSLRKQGLSLRAIADELNSNGFTTRRGKAFTAIQVSRAIEYTETEQVS